MPYHDIVDDGRCVPSDSPISPATACNNQTDLVLSGGLRQPVAGMDAGTPRLVNLLQHSTTVCLSLVFDPCIHGCTKTKIPSLTIVGHVNDQWAATKPTAGPRDISLLSFYWVLSISLRIPI